MTGKTAPGAGSSKLRRRPSHGRQPKFAPRARALLDEVDLLDLVLADVADDEVAVGAVEREAPRVAQAVGVDLAARARAPDERVRRRDRVRPPARRLRVDAQDLAQQRAERTARCRAVPCWSLPPPPSPVPTYISLSGPKTIRPPLWLGSGSSMRSTSARAAGVGAVRAGAAVLPDRLGAALLGVVDVEAAPTARSPGAKAIESRPCSPPAVTFERMSRNGCASGLPPRTTTISPRLLDDEEPPPVAGRRGDVDRGLEVADLDQAHAAAGRRAALRRAGAARVVVGARRRIGGRVGLLGVSSPIHRPPAARRRRGRARRLSGASAAGCHGLVTRVAPGLTGAP